MCSCASHHLCCSSYCTLVIGDNSRCNVDLALLFIHAADNVHVPFGIAYRSVEIEFINVLVSKMALMVVKVVSLVILEKNASIHIAWHLFLPLSLLKRD